MKVFRVKIESVKLKQLNKDVQIADFDHNDTLTIVRKLLSKENLLISSGTEPTYTWEENTLYVTGFAYFDDPDAPLMRYL